MYISRIEIDYANRQKMRDLTHAGAYHNWVERSFPQEFETNIRTRKLWRLDSLQGKEYLLIVSENQPDLKAFSRYGIAQTAITKNYDAYINRFREGDKMRFRVTLNPVISRAVIGGERGKVFPLYAVESQLDFLMQRAQKHGFLVNIEEVCVTGQRHEKLKKSHLKYETFLKVDYEGILTISNLASFQKMLIEGIGKKKAYGCGLMTVLPLTTS